MTLLMPASAMAAVQQNINISEAGTGEVVSCDPMLPSACHWRFTGTANGSGTPYNRNDGPVVVDLETSGTWPSDGEVGQRFCGYGCGAFPPCC